MSKRTEFTRKIMDKAFARANGYCENRKCGAPLHVGKFHYDHILPCALGGEPSLANCQVLCEGCHKAKTAKEDVPRIRKADRQRAKHIGAKTPSKNPIPQREPPPKPEKHRKESPFSHLGPPGIARRFK